jgi:hypothetical protein
MQSPIIHVVCSPSLSDVSMAGECIDLWQKEISNNQKGRHCQIDHSHIEKRGKSRENMQGRNMKLFLR